MANITDLSDLINRSTGGASGTPQNQFWFKSARIAGAAATAPIAGRPASLWRYDGQPSGGAIPTTVAIPTNTTAGALPFTNPGGGRQSWMVQSWVTGLVGGTLLMYDRLLHIGGLNGTLTSAQTVGGTITRNTTGDGNFAFAEIYTQIGATSRTITMSYTNQAGTDTRTSTAVAFGGTGFNTVTRAILLPLQSGDTGIRAIASATIAGGTTGIAGNFGITMGKPIAYTGVGTAGAAGWRDFVTGLPGIPEIASSACLSLLWFPQTTTVPELFGGYSIVEA
jgi:hypothetical protein